MEVEHIPDEDALYRWVPSNRVNAKGRPSAGAFAEHGAGMSALWSKHATPEEARALVRVARKDPQETGIAELRVGAVRSIGLSVVHAPRDWSAAHANVTGITAAPVEAEVRLKLADMARMVGFVPPPRK